MSNPVVKVENLVKRYKELIAVDHFNLEIKEGEVFGLLGPNGSGKSTTIHCILSLLKYDKGIVEVFGEKMTENCYHLKKDIGVIMQNVAVFEELNVYQNIDYFCGLYISDKKKRKEYVEEAIRFVGLEDYKKFLPKKLSGGLLRRLNIACGKVSRARLSDKEWQEVTKYYAYMVKNKKIDFYQHKRATVKAIRNKARELKLKKGLDVIIIDQIGKVVPEMKGSRYEQMTLISNELKRLAIELDVNVTVLCQLSRAVEQRSDKRPMLSDLRDSGAIEEDADNIGMLYRDGYYRARETGEEVTEDILEIDFQKVRNGRLAKVKFQYNLETQRLIQILN